jgi:nucleotide-binding universal stress UspA family protein
VVRPELVLGLEPQEEAAPIDFAFRTAAQLGLSIRAVRAFEPLPAYNGYLIEGIEDGRSAALLDMESLLKPGREQYPDVPVTLATRQDVPVQTLARAAHGARLLVVGSHHRHGSLGFGPGHIVHGLLAHADTPVAVVPIR